MSHHRRIGLCLVLLVLVAGCTSVQAPTETARKPVLLIAREPSDDLNLALTKEVGVMESLLEQAGYKVVVASPSGQPLVGATNTLKPDLKLADVKVDDYAGVLVPSMVVPEPKPSAEAVEIVKEAAAKGKPVAAQAGGVPTLGAAGVLNGKHYAIWVFLWPSMRMSVPDAVYQGEGVVQDGNIITSGIDPLASLDTGKPDGTAELTQKFIAALESSR
jgi:putative intracellular protease/amidase